MEIPFIRTARYFDLALDYQDRCDITFSKCCCSNIKNQMTEVRLLKNFDVYARYCRRNHRTLLEHDKEEKGYTKSDSLRHSIILFTI